MGLCNCRGPCEVFVFPHWKLVEILNVCQFVEGRKPPTSSHIVCNTEDQLKKKRGQPRNGRLFPQQRDI